MEEQVSKELNILTPEYRSAWVQRVQVNLFLQHIQQPTMYSLDKLSKTVLIWRVLIPGYYSGVLMQKHIDELESFSARL